MSSLSGALVRAALVSQLQAHAATGGVIEGATVLPEPPESYDDLYGQSRGVLDLIWIDAYRATGEITGFGSSGHVYTERATHSLVVQVDRQPGSWSMAAVDARTDLVTEYVLGIILGDPSLGIDVQAEGLQSIVVTPGSYEYRRRTLPTGGRTEKGHSAAYVLDVEVVASAKFTAPALP